MTEPKKRNLWNPHPWQLSVHHLVLYGLVGIIARACGLLAALEHQALAWVNSVPESAFGFDGFEQLKMALVLTLAPMGAGLAWWWGER
jgi:hypothetical protein